MSSEAGLGRTRRLSQPKPGWWELDGERICLYDIQAELSALNWAYFDEAGISASRFLYLAGLRAAVAMINRSPAHEHAGRLFHSGLQHLTRRGYGVFRTVQEEAEVTTVLGQDTLEAWAFRKHQSQAGGPVCNYTRGLLAGLACMALEARQPTGNIACWETECVAAGARACQFIIGSAEKLTQLGYQNPSEQPAPRWELEALNSQLRLSSDRLREAQSRLLQHQQAYQHLLDNMLDPLVVVDQRGTILFCNKRYLDITRQSPAEATGSRPLDFLHPDDKESARSVFRSLLDGRETTARYTFRILRGARTAVLECLARSIAGPDGEYAVEAICRDITGRERDRLALESANKQLLTKQKRADADLLLAKLVHESLLPMPVRTEKLDVDIKYVPIDRVGGDYCHIDMVGDRYAVLTICDVSGHGVAAALLASRVNSHLRSQDLVTPDPWFITNDLNDFLVTHFGETGLFVTFLAAVIDLSEMTVRFCGAGHPGPIIVHPDARPPTVIKSVHLPVGVTRHFHREPRVISIPLTPGDRIVLYTDGLVEFVNDQGKLDRIDSMVDVVASTASAGLFEWGDALLAQLAAKRIGKPQDDMTLMLAEIRSPQGR